MLLAGEMLIMSIMINPCIASHRGTVNNAKNVKSNLGLLGIEPHGINIINISPVGSKNASGRGYVNNVKSLVEKSASHKGNVNNVKSNLGLLGIEPHGI